jgi:hypothetical protein
MVLSPSAHNGNLTAIAATSAHDMWAVGSYNPATTSQPLFMHYDGQQWTLVPGPDTGADSGLSGVSASAPNDVWVVGFSRVSASPHMDPLVEHFDGTQWQIVPTADLGSGGGTLNSVAAIAPDDVWAVGITPNTQTGGWNPLIEHYDGTQWRVMPDASGSSSYLNAVAATSSSDVWVAGGGGVEHYDGTSWKAVPTAQLPGQTAAFYAMAASSPNDVWGAGIVGPSSVPGQPQASTSSQVITEHWDGTQWKVVPTPSAAPYTNILMGIAILAPGDVWVVGRSNFSQQGPVQATTLHFAP